ncbi:hypothetical protein ACLOJK_022557 [Asimina triloba]
MNLLKSLILKTLRERVEAAKGGSSPFSSYASDQQIDDFNSDKAEDMSCESREPSSDDDQVNYSHNIEENDQECFLRQLDEGTEDVGNDANNSSGENLAGKNICPGCCSGDNRVSEGTGLEPGAQAQAVDARELFLKAAVNVGELVWNQGLLKLFGICHDVELDRVQVDQRMSFRKWAFQRVYGGSPTNHE